MDEVIHGRDKDARALAATYVAFGMVAMFVLHHCSDRDFSAVLTAGSGIQCFGFYLLLRKARIQESVAGISRKTCEVYLVVLLCRLCSTTVRHGYLPVDRSGDHVYQLADVCSVMLLLQILYCIRSTHRHTYQAKFDSLPIWRVVPACFALATVLHGDLNHSFFYDTMWTASMNLETIAMLPQLWMLAHRGGEVEGLTAHYVAALFLNAVCRSAFWWYGYTEIGKADPSLSTWLAGYWILLAHGLQVIFSIDFMYHYFSGICGAEQKMILPDSAYDPSYL
jgi:hypothetical protein